jgi:phosphopantetheinyl transferase
VFFQLWARKEAYVKARGSGLFQELSGFSVPVDNGNLPEVGEKDGWIFQRLEAGSKYAAAMVTDKESDSVPCYDFGGLEWLD